MCQRQHGAREETGSHLVTLSYVAQCCVWRGALERLGLGAPFQGPSLESEDLVRVKFILGWPQHSRHNYGKTDISLIGLLGSYAISPREAGERRHYSKQREKGCSVKASFIGRRSCFGWNSNISLRFSSPASGLVLQQAALPSAQLRESKALSEHLWPWGRRAGEGQAHGAPSWAFWCPDIFWS